MKDPTPRSTVTRRALLALWLTTLAAFAGATLMTAAPACAAVPEPAYDAAFQQFQQAAAGSNTKAIEAAAEQFGQLAATDPADPVLLAYSGAATAMRATTTMLPWRKMSYAEDGLAQLDKALALLRPEHDTLLHKNVPASLETRLVAANTFLRLPSMFNRRARGVKLLDDVLKNPLLASAPAGFKAAVAAAQARAKDAP
jgi:hypothetical protein